MNHETIRAAVTRNPPGPRLPLLIQVAAMGLLLVGCGTVPVPSPAPSTRVASMSPSVDLSSVDPCDYLAYEEVAAIAGAGTRFGEQHLSALPGFRDCVFFAAGSVLATVGIRREATAAADAEALVTELFPLQPDVASVTVEGQPAYFLSCAEVWTPCRPAIAFATEPYFFVISVRSADDSEDVAVALASAVLANLQQ